MCAPHWLSIGSLTDYGYARTSHCQPRDLVWMNPFQFPATQIKATNLIHKLKTYVRLLQCIQTGTVCKTFHLYFLLRRIKSSRLKQACMYLTMLRNPNSTPNVASIDCFCINCIANQAEVTVCFKWSFIKVSNCSLREFSLGSFVSTLRTRQTINFSNR